MPGRKAAGGGAAAAAKPRRRTDVSSTEQIKHILASGQKSTATHKRLVGQLHKVCEQEGFAEHVTEAIAYVIASSLTGNVDRVVRLLFSALDDARCRDVVPAVVAVALDLTTADDKMVRRNACEVVRIAFEVSDNIDPDLLERVAEASHVLLDDKVVSVRTKAVEMIHRLQNPADLDDCDITLHYLQLLAQDIPAVRLAVLGKLDVKNKRIAPHLLRCTSDMSFAVRRAAYTRLAEVGYRNMNIAERMDLLTRGLSERSPDLRRIARSIVAHWLKLHRNSVVDVLALFDIENNEALSVQVAEVLYTLWYARPKTDDVKAWDTKERDALIQPDANGMVPAEGILMVRVVVAKLREEDSERADTYMCSMDACTGSLLHLFQQATEGVFEKVAGVEAAVEQFMKLGLLYEPDHHTKEQRDAMLSSVFNFGLVFNETNPTRFVETVISLSRHFCRGNEEELNHWVFQLILSLRQQLSVQHTVVGGDDGEMFFDAEAQSRMDQEKQRQIAERSEQVSEKERRILGMRRRGEPQYAIDTEEAALKRLEEDLGQLESESRIDTALWIRILDVIHQLLAGVDEDEANGLTRPATDATVQQRSRHASVALTAAKDHHNGYVRSKALTVLAVYAVTQRAVAPTYASLMTLALYPSSYRNFEQTKLPMRAALYGLIDVFLQHGAMGFYSPPAEYGRGRGGGGGPHTKDTDAGRTGDRASAVGAPATSVGLSDLDDVAEMDSDRELPTQEILPAGGGFATPAAATPVAAPSHADRIAEMTTAARGAAVRQLDILLRFSSLGACSIEGHWGTPDAVDLIGTGSAFHDGSREAAEARAERSACRRALQSIATVGLAKLLACNRAPAGEEHRVLKQLCLFYFNPAYSHSKQDIRGTVRDQATLAHAMQTLSVFFSTYAFSSAVRQRKVGDAVPTVIRYIVRDAYHYVRDEAVEPEKYEPVKAGGAAAAAAASTSATAVLAFLAHLTDAAQLKAIARKLQEDAGVDGETPDAAGEDAPAVAKPVKLPKAVLAELAELSLHEEIAQRVLLDVCVDVEHGDVAAPKRYLKILQDLTLYSVDKASILGLVPITQRALAVVSDKAVAQMLQKWRDALTKLKIPDNAGFDVAAAVDAHSREWAEEVSVIPTAPAPPASAKPSRRRGGTAAAGGRGGAGDAGPEEVCLTFDSDGGATPAKPTPKPKRARKPAAKAAASRATKRKRPVEMTMSDEDNDDDDRDDADNRGGKRARVSGGAGRSIASFFKKSPGTRKRMFDDLDSE